MQRICQQCGSTFEAKRVSAKYCTDQCRAMASNIRLGKSPPKPLTVTPPAPPPGGIMASTLARLEALGKVDDPSGQVALMLAQQMDAGMPPGALAGVSKEHRATLEALAVGAKVAADPMDELTARRRNRGA